MVELRRELAAARAEASSLHERLWEADAERESSQAEAAEARTVMASLRDSGVARVFGGGGLAVTLVSGHGVSRTEALGVLRLPAGAGATARGERVALELVDDALKPAAAPGGLAPSGGGLNGGGGDRLPRPPRGGTTPCSGAASRLLALADSLRGAAAAQAHDEEAAGATGDGGHSGRPAPPALLRAHRLALVGLAREAAAEIAAAVSALQPGGKGEPAGSGGEADPASSEEAARAAERGRDEPAGKLAGPASAPGGGSLAACLAAGAVTLAGLGLAVVLIARHRAAA